MPVPVPSGCSKSQASKHVIDDDLGVKGLANLTGADYRVRVYAGLAEWTPILGEIRGIVTFRGGAQGIRDAAFWRHLTKHECDSLRLLSLIAHLPRHLGACHRFLPQIKSWDLRVSESEGAASNGGGSSFKARVGSMRSTKRTWAFKVRKWVFLSLSVCVPLCALSVPLQCQQTPVVWELGTNSARLQETANSIAGQGADAQTPGNIRGRVVDQLGANITGALVKLTREGQSSSQEVESDEEGQFFFFNIDPGAFKLTVSSEGLASQTVSGSVKAGETCVVPQVRLVVATQVTEVRVGLPPAELAEVQIEDQEKQRAFGFLPNFYVSYVHDAAPLSPRLKFRLAWKSASDPVTLAGVGWLAGIDQATDRWGAYGQGVQGYAKRYGATYADVFGATFLGGAVLPSLLKQDPRYFYKGNGSKRSRILYAISNSFICKGDNGRWQPNYSNVLGSFGAAGIANLYYPAADRRGAASVVATAAIRLGETSLAAILQEFVFPRFSSHRSARAQSQP